MVSRKEMREVTCILCPLGCRAIITVEDEEPLEVENVECPRGEKYVLGELRAPMRDFFTTVRVRGARIAVLPVRTTGPIPKGKIDECVSELAKITVDSPVRVGDVVVKNILNLGVDIVATRDVDRYRM